MTSNRLKPSDCSTEPPTNFVFRNCDWDANAIASFVTELGATMYEPFDEPDRSAAKVARIRGHGLKLFMGIELCERLKTCFTAAHIRPSNAGAEKTLVVYPARSTEFVRALLSCWTLA